MCTYQVPGTVPGPGIQGEQGRPAPSCRQPVGEQDKYSSVKEMCLDPKAQGAMELGVRTEGLPGGGKA